jgi:hypothetical protein
LGERESGERGSTVPLILGFFLLALIMVAGSVAAASAYLAQRSLQSICDGAALAGASSLDVHEVFEGDLGGYGDLPLAAADTAIERYLSRDAARAGVRIEHAEIEAGVSVVLDCQQHTGLAFGALFGYADGVDHHARATARARLR